MYWRNGSAMMASVIAAQPTVSPGVPRRIIDQPLLAISGGSRVWDVAPDGRILAIKEVIGNAGAALQGAPVTTVDFDFLFRKSPRNLAKLKTLARRLRATILRPYYPVSDLFRLVRDDDGLQLDFMVTIHGIRSYEGLRDRATWIDVGGVPIRVASLADIIKSKRAAGRPRDLAVLDVLETAREEAAQPPRPPRRRLSRKST